MQEKKNSLQCIYKFTTLGTTEVTEINPFPLLQVI